MRSWHHQGLCRVSSVASPGLVDVAAMGGADNVDGCDARMREQRINRFACSPWTTLKTPSGSPASARSSAQSIDGDGSFSDGLSTKVLPQAMAIGYIHIGTMAGKLNGVISPPHPTADSYGGVDTGRDLLAESPLKEAGDVAGELDDFEPRCTSPSASSMVFPCSAVRSLAMSSRASCHQLAERRNITFWRWVSDEAPRFRRPVRRPSRRYPRRRQMPGAPRRSEHRLPG